MSSPWRPRPRLAPCAGHFGRSWAEVFETPVEGVAERKAGMVGKELTPEERAALVAQIERLREEHRDLDAAIEALSEAGQGDRLQLQRLKKRKLLLRDKLTLLEDRITPTSSPEGRTRHALSAQCRSAPSVRSRCRRRAGDLREAFNHAYAEHTNDPRQEEAAFRIAWAAVKRVYEKVGDTWVRRGEANGGRAVKSGAAKTPDQVAARFHQASRQKWSLAFTCA